MRLTTGEKIVAFWTGLGVLLAATVVDVAWHVLGGGC